MRTLTLDPSLDARGRGRQHGAAFAGEIRRIAEIRLGLMVELGGLGPAPQVLAAAERHLPVLRDFDRDLYEELLGIAEGSGCDPARIVVLNHYTDLRDLNPEHANLEFAEEDCTAVFARSPEGPLLGQTWDMHGSAAPFVIALEVPAHQRADGKTAPAATVLTLTGCLALAGMNSAGVGVTINNLISLDAQIGVVWPALVRRLLVERTAREALEVLLRTPVGSGHHYMVVDETDAFAVETSGVHRELVFEGEVDRYHHTNHCLHEVVAAASRVGEPSTTRERYAWMEGWLGRAGQPGMREVWEALGSHEGHPRGICTHLAGEEAPHAMLTCGGILMNPARREVWALDGCLHGREPVRFHLSEEVPARGR